MYAIVEISGKQYKIEKDSIVNVDRLKSAEKNLTLDKVILYSNNGDIQVGQPYLKNVKVQAELMGEVKGNKVFGIKFKKRKNYTRTIGHRAIYTQIKINAVVVG